MKLVCYKEARGISGRAKRVGGGLGGGGDGEGCVGGGHGGGGAAGQNTQKRPSGRSKRDI